MNTAYYKQLSQGSPVWGFGLVLNISIVGEEIVPDLNINFFKAGFVAKKNMSLEEWATNKNTPFNYKKILTSGSSPVILKSPMTPNDF